MVIVLFLIDTTPSMYQRTYLGPSLLDVAKTSVDTFSKFRARDPACRGDRYMLVTFDEQPHAVKSGWKESHSHFLMELKTLQAYGICTFGQSLKAALDLLNSPRLHTGIDNYGQGRNPFFLEPAVIIAVTDSTNFTTLERAEKEVILLMLVKEEISAQLCLPPDVSEMQQLTKEPYRWDQRLFTIMLKLPGVGPASEDCLPGETALSSLCEDTGGQLFVVPNQRSFIQSMEYIAQRMHPGVVLCLRKIGYTPSQAEGEGQGHTPGMRAEEEKKVGVKTEAEPTPIGMSLTGERDSRGGGESWQNVKKMIYVKYNPKTNVAAGHWPIPESFWPDMNTKTLPARSSSPVVWFRDTDVAPMLIESFPFDKYELEPSPLTQHILAKKNPNICWEVYIANGGKEGEFSHPFGYLKASSSLQCVNLFIMPFNYRQIIPLIDDLIRNRMKPPPNWRHGFAEYISTLPSYYAQPLRNAMRLLGASPSLVPEFFDGQMSPDVATMLKKFRKQAKMESERIISSVARNKGDYSSNNHKNKTQLYFGPHISVNAGLPLATLEGGSPWKVRPLEVPRLSLLQQLKQMRDVLTQNRPKFSQPVEVNGHEIPISQMGNYQEHLKRISPLREVDTGAVRTQLFGNPYRLEKNDTKRENEEADEHMVNLGSSRRKLRPHSRGLRSRSRSASPLPPTPPHSPIDVVPTTSERNTPKAPHIQPAPHQPDPVVSSRKPPARKAEPMDHSGRTSPELLLSSLSNLATSATVDSSPQEKSGDGFPLERAQPNKPAEQASQEGTKADGGAKGGHLVVLKQAEKRRSPSPNELLGMPAKRQLSTDQAPPPSSKKPKTIQGAPPSASLHGPLRLGLKTEGSSASKVLTEEFQKQQGQENAKVKASILKEIRKPGKNNDAILKHIKNVRGSVEVKRVFVQDIMKEAKRWKKKGLLEQLEEWLSQNLPQDSGPEGRKGGATVRAGPSGGLAAKLGAKAASASGDNGKAERTATSSTVSGKTQGNHQQ